jgi:flagellar biogenesis protein FliO
VPVMLWLSWEYPLLFFAGLAVALVVMGVLIWVLAKFLRQVVRRFSRATPA